MMYSCYLETVSCRQQGHLPACRWVRCEAAFSPTFDATPKKIVAWWILG